ncbi:uncharacterized protein [Lolium perenne]|uniref:uncharacterized protein n=1 Tax=Lolium perenne TaxID=4522 RepID=UPI003A9A6690
MASSTAMSTTALAAALGSPPSQPLTRENALIWKALVIPALRGARVLDLVEGVDKAPAETLAAENANSKKITIANPEYKSWIARDQQVLRWLLNGLSPDVLSHVIGLETSAEVWASLDSHVSAKSKTRVQQLRSALNDTRKNDLSAYKYFAKMKSIASEFAAAGKPLDDDELVYYVLHGLGTKCKSLTGKTESRTLVLSLRPTLLAGTLVLAKMIVVLAMMIVLLARTTVLATMIAAAKIALDKISAGTEMSALGAMTMSAPGAMMMSVPDAMMMTAVVMVVRGVTASLHPMWTPLVRFALFMDTLPVTAGGVMEMIVMVTVDRKGQTLPPMVLIQIVFVLLKAQDPTDAAENSLQNDAPTPQTSAAETAENDELGAGSEADSGEHSSPASADSEEDSPAPPSPFVPSSSSASDTPRASPRHGSVSPPVRPAPALEPARANLEQPRGAAFRPAPATADAPPGSAAPGEPRNLPDALADSHWRAAMQDEYDALMMNKTWTLVPPSENKNVIDCKWVYRIKRRADGTIDRYKARLVAKGFKQRSSDHAVSTLLKDLNAHFAIKDLGPLHFFLGIEVTRTHDALLLTQEKYAHDLVAKVVNLKALVEVELNDKQLELVRFEKRLELDDWWNSKMLFGNRLFG